MTNKEKFSIYEKIKRRQVAVFLPIDLYYWIREEMTRRDMKNMSPLIVELIKERREAIENEN